MSRGNRRRTEGRESRERVRQPGRGRGGKGGQREGRGGGREGPKSGLTEESKQRSSVGRLSRSEWAKTNKVLHFQISTLKT